MQGAGGHGGAGWSGVEWSGERKNREKQQPCEKELRGREEETGYLRAHLPSFNCNPSFHSGRLVLTVVVGQRERERESSGAGSFSIRFLTCRIITITITITIMMPHLGVAFFRVYSTVLCRFK